MLKLYVTDKNNKVLSEIKDDKNAVLVYGKKYKKGDSIHLEVEKPGFYEVSFDDAIGSSIVYIKAHASFAIPFGMMNKVCYSPRAFRYVQHLLTAKHANPEFVYARRNLALNPFDGHNSRGLYPHASANVETRDEALFAARNAIDGIFANDKHYPYPYQSWGINKNPDAELTIDFGVMISFDEICLTLRADYPHDSFWTSAELEFSDRSVETVNLEKLAVPQSFKIAKDNITWLKLKNLIKNEDDSPFPALTQIEVFGRINKQED